MTNALMTRLQDVKRLEAKAKDGKAVLCYHQGNVKFLYETTSHILQRNGTFEEIRDFLKDFGPIIKLGRFKEPQKAQGF